MLRIFRLNVPLKGTTDRRASNIVWGATIARSRGSDEDYFGGAWRDVKVEEGRCEAVYSFIRFFLVQEGGVHYVRARWLYVFRNLRFELTLSVISDTSCAN